MSGCSNCFNGCVQTTSDQCVKYTGPNISEIGIETGHPLSATLSDIISTLVQTLTGTNILPDIDPEALCTVITDELPQNPTLIQVIESLTKAICSLSSDIDNLEGAIGNIEAPYNLGGCIPGVLPIEGTHAILEAVISKLCSVSSIVSALNVSINDYVKTSDINTYIQNYINSQNTNYHYLKMVPYTVVEYYGTFAPFDGTGAGMNEWTKIYLCNGQNGTPDKRGRIPIGTTIMGNGNFDPIIQPGNNGNRAYELKDKHGWNFITLSGTQMPTHTHIVNTTVNEPPHTHILLARDTNTNNSEKHWDRDYISSGPQHWYQQGQMTSNAISSEKTNITVNVTADPVGGNLPHDNVPPVLACHYIMYIP